MSGGAGFRPAIREDRLGVNKTSTNLAPRLLLGTAGSADRLGDISSTSLSTGRLRVLGVGAAVSMHGASSFCVKRAKEQELRSE
jgi:hypothetical protein